MAIPIDLNGKITLVSGAGKNIGRAVALSMAQAGAKVAITFQSNEALAQETVSLVSANGGECAAFQVEMTDPGAIRSVIDDVEQRFGTVDVLVNSAAIRPPNSLETLTVAMWDEVMNTNARGPLLLAQRVAPGMREKQWGRILFVGGVGAYIGSKNVALGASKFALVGMARSLASTLGPHRITVNVVVPGIIDTHHEDTERYGHDSDRRAQIGRIPVGRLGQPDDVAQMCVFLASDAASFVSGQEIFVSGGTFPVML